MGTQISRTGGFQLSTQGAQITASLATTSEIFFEDFICGTIFIPVGSGLTTLTYYGTPRPSSEPDPTTPANQLSPAPVFLALNTGVPTPVAVTQTVAASNAYDLPQACQGCGSIKIVGNTTGAVSISKKS